jgi:hypothetical protein
MAQQVGRGGGVLDDGAVGAEVAAQDGDAAFGRQRLVQRINHIAPCHMGGSEVVAQPLAGDGQAIEVQQRRDLLEDSRNAPRLEQIFHVVLARRTQVDDKRGGAADLIDRIERERQA